LTLDRRRRPAKLSSRGQAATAYAPPPSQPRPRTCRKPVRSGPPHGGVCQSDQRGRRRRLRPPFARREPCRACSDGPGRRREGASCVVAGEQLGRRAAARLVLAIDVGERLPVGVADDEAGVSSTDQGGREAASGGDEGKIIASAAGRISGLTTRPGAGSSTGSGRHRRCQCRAARWLAPVSADWGTCAGWCRCKQKEPIRSRSRTWS
jgi:hypothetical protein